MLTNMDKIIQGLNVTLNHLVNNSAILILIMTIVIFYKFYKENKSKNLIIVSSIPMGYMILRVLPLNALFSRIINTNGIDLENILDKFLYTFPVYSDETVMSVVSYLPTIIGSFIVLITAILVYNCFKDSKNSMIYSLLYLAGISASIVISFSPTIFASGERIFMVNDIMFIITTMAVFNEIIKQREENDNNKINICEKIFMISIAILAIINAMN